MILLRELAIDDFRPLERVRLAFPDRASILVDGLNEAGKSSLFEAIVFALFGRLLPSTLSDPESVVRHGAERARVLLRLAGPDGDWTIERSLHRDGTSEAWLQTGSAGRPAEMIEGPAAVDERLDAAVAGLTPEAFLTACYVEQQRIDRLESLDPAERQAAILRLLHLDRLTALARRYELKPADLAELWLATAHRDLAAARAELPVAEAAVERAARALGLADLAAALREAETADATVTSAAREHAEGQAERGALVARLARLDEFEEARQASAAAGRRVGDIERAGATADAARAELAAIDETAAEAADLAERQARLADLVEAVAERAELTAAIAEHSARAESLAGRSAGIAELSVQIARDAPRLAADRAELERLCQRRDTERAALEERLAALNTLSARLDDLTAEKQAAVDLSRRVREARQAADQPSSSAADRLLAAEASAQAAFAAARDAHVAARERLRRAEAADALERWLLAHRPPTAPEGGPASPPAASGESFRTLELQAAHGWDSARKRARRNLLLAVVSFAVCFASITAVVLGYLFLAPVAAIGFIVGGLFLHQWTKDQAEVQIWQADLETHRATARGDRRADDAPAAGPETPADVARPAGEPALVLDLHGEAEPASTDEAVRRIGELRDGLIESLDDLRAAEQAADAAALAARRRWDEARAAREQIAAEAPGDAAEAERLANEYRHAAAAFNERARAALADAAALNVALDNATIAQEIGQATLALTTIDLELSRLPELEARVARESDELAAAEARLAELRAVAPDSADDGDAAAVRAEADRCRTPLEEVARRIEMLAAETRCAPDQAATAAESAAAALGAAQARLASRMDVTDRMAGAETVIATARQELTDVRTRLLAAGSPAVPPPLRDGGDDLAAWRAALVAADKWIAEEVAGEDRNALTAQVSALDRTLGGVEARRAAADERRTAAGEQIRRAIARLGADLGVAEDAGVADRAALLARYPDLAATVPEERAALGADRDAAVHRRDALRERLAELEAAIPDAGPVLDPATATADLARLEEDHVIRRQAVAIMERARNDLLTGVRPHTEANLRHLLPALTAGRYHEARLTPDFAIEVWDPAAGAFTTKPYFSGGTRDQLSLALRLAFALAALPADLATSPGFLFLDEPLGSFDPERAAALLDLLRTGPVAEAFPQIFLITHVRGFEPGAFSHEIQMAGGRVAATNLAQPTEPAGLPA